MSKLYNEWMCAALIITPAWKVSVFGVFLVRIFPHLDWIRKDTPYLSIFSPNARKCGPEKLRIRTLCTQFTSIITIHFIALHHFSEYAVEQSFDSPHYLLIEKNSTNHAAPSSRDLPAQSKQYEQRCNITKTPVAWRRSGVFVVNFEHILHIVLVFLLLTLNMSLPTGYIHSNLKHTSITGIKIKQFLLLMLSV